MHAFFVLLILNIIVIVHEIGHFVMAKALRIKPRTFAVGFWKTVWQFKGKDGVVYKINLLPLGGYVDFDMKEFQKENPYKKFLVLFNGIFFNFLLAILFSFVFVMITKMPLVYTDVAIPSLPWGFSTAVAYTWQSVMNTFALVVENFKTFFVHPDLNAIAGPIQVMREGSALLQQDFLLFLPLFVVLDVNVIILNALPLPALDGGRMIFALIEMITKKKIKYEESIHLTGFVFLMLLMVILLGKDIFVVFIK